MWRLTLVGLEPVAEAGAEAEAEAASQAPSEYFYQAFFSNVRSVKNLKVDIQFSWLMFCNLIWLRQKNECSFARGAHSR